MGNDSREETLIVGAGPTGLTAAIELARRGLSVRIIDRDDAPTPLSKAVGISSHSLDILAPSGVTESLLASGIKIRHGYVHYGTRELGMIDFSILKHRYNFLLSLPQSDTETIMSEVLTRFGIKVEWSTQLCGLRQERESASAELRSKSGSRIERFRRVFGADGVHSAVRGAIDIPFEGKTHRRTWSIADAHVADWPYEADAAQLFFHPGGDLGFVIPIGEGRIRAVSNTEDALVCIPGSHSVTNVLRSDSFRIPVRHASSFQRGNVYLGGDAAHAHSPVGARGMNLGIEDASSFAQRLSENRLDGYSAERQPIAQRWIGCSERVLALAQSSDWFDVAFRNLLFSIVGHLHMLQRPMLRRVAGLRE